MFYFASVVETNDVQNYRLEGYLSYDATNRRQRFIWRETKNNQVQEYERLFLEKQNVLYQYNIITKTCSQIQNFEWKAYDVPKDSTFIGASYIGAAAVPNGNLVTNTWAKNFTDTQGATYEFIGIWSNAGCIPLRSIVSGPNFGIARSNFYDITPGIQSKTKIQYKHFHLNKIVHVLRSKCFRSSSTMPLN